MKGQWSRVCVVLVAAVLWGYLGLSQVVAAPLAECAPTQIKISEVEADPVLSNTDTTDEWFELYNTGEACSMIGWQITDNSGIWETLPSFNIAANGQVVVAATSNFQTNHPAFTGARVMMSDGSIGNGLANAGDVLSLRDASAVEADCVSWGSVVSCLNPAIMQNTANTTATYQRTPTSGTDSNASADWTSAPESLVSAPTAVTLNSLNARGESSNGWLGWGMVGLGMITWFAFLYYRQVH